MGTTGQIRKFYRFLVHHALSGKPFEMSDVINATGWAPNTVNTYLHKQAKNVIVRPSRGTYSVRRTLLYLKENEFVERVSQKENILPSYARTSFSSVLAYEFLMPLTKEDHLRRNLDELFYSDTLKKRIEALGLGSFESILSRRTQEGDDRYLERLVARVSQLFGGYSVFHVNGRFRVTDIQSQIDAIGQRYVIDETTAVVRFLIPCESGSQRHGDVFEPMARDVPASKPLDEEVTTIRGLFLSIFAEVVVHSVQGEDQIWLLETINGQHTLYRWSLD